MHDLHLHFGRCMTDDGIPLIPFTWDMPPKIEFHVGGIKRWRNVAFWNANGCKWYNWMYIAIYTWGCTRNLPSSTLRFQYSPIKLLFIELDSTDLVMSVDCFVAESHPYSWVQKCVWLGLRDEIDMMCGTSFKASFATLRDISCNVTVVL